MRAVFSLHGPAVLGDLMRGAAFENVDARSSVKTLRLPAPEDFLWQYVHSTPLAGSASELNEERRAALEREVVAGWQPFTEDGRLVLEVGTTVATARK